MGTGFFVKKVSGRKQADGAFTVKLGAKNDACRHQIQVEVSSKPSSGTLTVEIRSPKATGFCSIDDNVIDMTGDDLIKIIGDYAYVAEFRFTPENFDADKTFDVIITSGG